MARKSADCGGGCSQPFNGQATQLRSDVFLQGLAQSQQVTLVAHVHPDPDSLASMMGLAHLVQTQLHKTATLTCDGRICRAENRAMVDLLDVHLTPIDRLDPDEFGAVVMVD